MNNYQQPPRRSGLEESESRRLIISQINSASDSLISFGVRTVKKNPIKMTFWVIGLGLGFFFNGSEVTPSQMLQYSKSLDKIPHAEIARAAMSLAESRAQYEASRGWFWSCNTPICQANKSHMDADMAVYSNLRQQELELMRDAKQSVGIFSEHGVSDTREAFWSTFQSGKNFATRQTKWDILFAGISAIGRDEKVGSFLLRIVVNFVVNITLGIIGAVISFWWSLWGLIQEYRVGLLTGLTFFAGAALAAFSFALMWLFGIYAATTGAVFVAAKVLATNVRIENSRDRQRMYHVRED